MTKRQAWVAAAFLMGVVAAAGCGGGANAPGGGPGQASTRGTGEAPAAGTVAEPPRGEGHADASVVPGSYEDWCDEHAVPESACTRCDATLIPAFKTVGDWCDEHGLPKSQCLKCDPNLRIVRPAKSERS